MLREAVNCAEEQTGLLKGRLLAGGDPERQQILSYSLEFVSMRIDAPCTLV